MNSSEETDSTAGTVRRIPRDENFRRRAAFERLPPEKTGRRNFCRSIRPYAEDGIIVGLGLLASLCLIALTGLDPWNPDRRAPRPDDPLDGMGRRFIPAGAGVDRRFECCSGGWERRRPSPGRA